MTKKAGVMDEYREVVLGGKKVLLDKDIPVIKRLSKDADKAKAQILKAVSTKLDEDWTHQQVALHVDPTKIIPGFKKKVVFTRLPGEKYLTRSYRGPEGLHAHHYRGTWLVHKDKHDASQPLRHPLQTAAHALTEGLPSMVKRLKADHPLLFPDLEAFRAELSKLAEEKTVAEIVSRPAEVAFLVSKAGYVASFPVSVLASSSEDPKDLERFIRAVAKEEGIKLSKVKVHDRTRNPIKMLFSGSQAATVDGAISKIETAASRPVALHELGHAARDQVSGGANPNFLDKFLYKALGGKMSKPSGVLGGYHPFTYPITQPWVRIGEEVGADAFMFKHMKKSQGTAAAVRGVMAKSPGLMGHTIAALLPGLVVMSPVMIAAHRARKARAPAPEEKEKTAAIQVSPAEVDRAIASLT